MGLASTVIVLQAHPEFRTDSKHTLEPVGCSEIDGTIPVDYPSDEFQGQAAFFGEFGAR